VGHTNDIKRREFQHRYKLISGIGSTQIPEYMEWEFEVLEKCEESNKRERERYWWDQLKPLYNLKCPLLTPEERRERQEIWEAKKLLRDKLREASENSCENSVGSPGA